jgi:transcriptional regulator with XRE-family HTH domain
MTNTLAELMREIRTRKKLSMREAARRIGKSAMVIHHLEHGQYPLITTLIDMLKAYGVKPGDAEYGEAMNLWISAQSGRTLKAADIARSVTHGTDHKREQVQSIVETIMELPQDLQDHLIRAVQRPAVIVGLANLNKIYDDAKAEGEAA